MFEKTKREGEEEGILFYTLVLYCYTYIVSFVFLNITNVVLYPLLSTLVFGAPTVQHAHTERFEFEIETFEINFSWGGGWTTVTRVLGPSRIARQLTVVIINAHVRKYDGPDSLIRIPEPTAKRNRSFGKNDHVAPSLK